MRKVFLDELPHKGSRIDWRNSIGCKIKFIYDDIQGELTIVDYDKDTYKIYLIYLDIEKIFPMLIADLKKCRLSKLLGKTTRDFRIEIGTIIKDNKRDLIIINREYRTRKHKNNSTIHDKYYKYKCNKCGWTEGWIVENAILSRKIGCSCCQGRTVAEGINDIPTTAPWMVKYFQGGYDEAKLYTKSSEKRIYPICPDCGRVKDKSIAIRDIYNDKSIGCMCSDGKSYPEKLMFSMLEQLNIKFQTQYSPDWSHFIFNKKNRKRIYDFYFEVNNKKYIIETDGGWHTKDNKLSKQTAEESKQIDDYKDKLAEEHNIQVIRIDCEESNLEYIKNNILHSKLDDIFDLSKIDWLKCDEFALSNLIKKICNYKKENSNMTTTEIGKVFGFVHTTICKYLKQGTELGWCNYNVNEEIKRRRRIAGKSHGKLVEIFKNKKSLGLFNSCTELGRQSEKTFNIKLNYSNIAMACKTQKPYKGFTFKYVEQDK